MRKLFATVLIAGLVSVGLPVGAFAGAPAPNDQGAQNTPSLGSVQGVVRDAEQHNLPHVRIQVRDTNGQLAAVGMSNDAGAFSFTGLAPATYTFEILGPSGSIVGTASVAVSAGATTVVTLTAAALGSMSAAAAGGAGLLGLGTLGTVAVITAASAAAVTAVISTKKDASPSR